VPTATANKPTRQIIPAPDDRVSLCERLEA
jgi:hypothetical protein